MDIIELLPDRIANQIAAGEVVQRPSSVVKELLENSVDAQSTSINLILQDAGKKLIKVIDDGVGMSPNDARMSFKRHATSKIRCADDLFKLKTKGFRGEALASIASVSHVEMKTKFESAELGVELKVEKGEVLSQEEIVLSRGTSIGVKNIFFNIPARRKFLKSDKIELKHIIDEFQRVVLSHPEISFTLSHNNSDIYNLNSTNLKKRIISLFGKKSDDSLVRIEEESPDIHIYGFIGKPSLAKKTRGEQFFFVNNRFIRSSYINHAINSSFEGLLLSGYHPSYFIYMDIDPSQIDVNIHPSKTEIKFENDSYIYALIKSVVKKALGQYNITSTINFENTSLFDIPDDKNYQKKNVFKASSASVKVDRNFNPFTKEYSQKPQWEGIYENTENINVSNEIKSDLDSSEPYSSLIIEKKDVQDSLFERKEYNDISPYSIHGKYILSHKKSGVILIHQNRAHQRILYEKYKSPVKLNQIVSQKLLFGIDIALNKDDIIFLKEIYENLKNMGFEIDGLDSDINTISVKGLPPYVDAKEVKGIIEDIIENFKLDREIANNKQDMMIKSIVKNLAVKTGQSLDKETMVCLIDQLFACNTPMLCPFGKTTFITLNISDIDKKFN
ncbi:DNA mismatch repair endonuclease MutL [Ichthyobacterium seriolicida]|uniref:DNA mismatch repair protein MutL n=1 Tax=Ichthyobacterium seriolicida TaxID=242600 RepID=A0A1J1DWE4_9FLAO|nr:DNA mismatch repair endonuclease MutL [Ichthyobacterium seriolicida]BAV94178.1 DNA mismatch repair protein MutL [Ichthyobacterium seriolicida]